MILKKNILGIPGWSPIFIPLRARLAILVPEECKERDGKSQRVQDLVLHGREDRGNVGGIIGNRVWTQIGMPGYWSGKKRDNETYY